MNFNKQILLNYITLSQAVQDKKVMLYGEKGR